MSNENFPINLEDFNPEYLQHGTITDDPRIQFKFRARTVGFKEYICLFCGHHNRHRMWAKTFITRCQSEDCRRLIGHGDIAYVLEPGPKSFPPDLIIPRMLREAYPQGDLARWSSGQTVNEVRVLGWPDAT